jgi:peptide-methionine (S)-S-oxide reductase
MPINKLPASSARRWPTWVRGAAGALAILAVLGAWWQMSVRAAEPAAVIPAPAMDAPKAASNAGLQTVVLAGGCFWGVQAVFQHVKGVSQAVSGYAGGTKETAIYEVVSSGRTGHAESVQVTFDPRQISFRQGPDSGPQYRSAIFYQDDSQKSIAQAYIAQLDQTGVFKRPIVTQINQLSGFYPAEDYHQDYATLHPSSPYIAFNDLPKVDNLHHVFGDIYRDKPVLVSAASQSN